MPPPQKTSTSLPSGRQVNTRAASPELVTCPAASLNSWPWRPSHQAMRPVGVTKQPWMSAALPVKPNWLTISSRRSATPSPSVSCKRQMLGGLATYSAPRYQAAPCGKVILSANTVLWSKRPSPSVSSSMRIMLGSRCCSSSAGKFNPALSATNSRPRSSKPAMIGCSTRGVAATSSTTKPSGTRIESSGEGASPASTAAASSVAIAIAVSCSLPSFRVMRFQARELSLPRDEGDHALRFPRSGWRWY